MKLITSYNSMVFKCQTEGNFHSHQLISLLISLLKIMKCMIITLYNITKISNSFALIYRIINLQNMIRMCLVVIYMRKFSKSSCFYKKSYANNYFYLFNSFSRQVFLICVHLDVCPSLSSSPHEAFSIQFFHIIISNLEIQLKYFASSNRVSKIIDNGPFNLQ